VVSAFRKLSINDAARRLVRDSMGTEIISRKRCGLKSEFGAPDTKEVVDLLSGNSKLDVLGRFLTVAAMRNTHPLPKIF
jgi:hypothetical protein